MRNARTYREDFDMERDFVALRAFVFSAQGFVPGQPVDKSKFTKRRLNQLFDLRRVGYPEQYWGTLGVQPMNGAPALPNVPDGPETDTEKPKEAGGSVPRREPRRLIPRRHQRKDSERVSA
jgi:hypothetical protein